MVVGPQTHWVERKILCIGLNFIFIILLNYWLSKNLQIEAHDINLGEIYVYHCLVHKLIFNLPYSHHGWKCIASKICWSLGHSLPSNSFWICGIWIFQPMIIQLHSYQNYCHPIFSQYTKVSSWWFS